MMELPATITQSNFPEKYVLQMDTRTAPWDQIFQKKLSQFVGLSSLTPGAYVITATVSANPTIASQSIDLQGITVGEEDILVLGTSFNYRRNISTGSISQMTVTPTLSEFRLVSLGMLLAQRLVNTLDQIRAYDRLAIYPIVSILKPYYEEAEELNLGMSLIASLPTNASVLDKETAESRDTDVKGESFFRFLDELETRTYKPNDTEDEE